MTPTTRTSERSPRSALLAVALAGAMALPLAPPVAGSTTDAAPLARVVVTSATESVSTVARAVVAAGGRVLDRLPLVGGVSAELPAGGVLAPAYLVVPDRALTLAGTASTDPVSTVRQTLGLEGTGSEGEGEGVTVAVVDTGVADHPDLAGRLSHVDVTGEGAGDGYGHGTFIAGLVAGSGASSGGAYAGVAPGADVLDVKVGRADGSTDLVTVLRGLQAAARADVDVLNLSLSSGSPLPYQLDPLNRALQALWERGVVVVVPSGNVGTEVSAPGNDPLLLTVGGLDESGTAARDDDAVASWSGRGPTDQGVAKPDLVAPGASVVSLRATGSVVDAANASARVGTSYFKGSGTSFATAVTSGAVAALLAERRLTPDQVKAVVVDSAYDAAGLRNADAAGAGGLDVAAALRQKAPSVGKAAKRNGADDHLGAVPGSPRAWALLMQALASGDQAGAASSWGALSPAARNWAARNWAGLDDATREWAARNWATSDLAGWGEEWAARNWAARNWAASSWAASSWGARNWSARNWSARNWADAWDARNWSDEEWAARNWSARNWSDEEWAA
ncbi:MAG: S8 family serine peptidase, partial [Mycobacteriales bacterium]|nr:S8 family serine peptidase [Mycobacteriales bacterium]